MCIAPAIAMAQDSLLVKKHFIEIGADYSVFSDNTDPWYFLTAMAKLGDDNDIFLPKVQYGSRFAQSGILGALDYYRIFRNKDYLMLTASVASMPVFPGYVAGMEYFNPFAKKFEMSVGAKYLVFQNDVQIMQFTGSFSAYYGRWLSIVRPFLAIQDLNDRISNVSVAFQQRYFRTDHHYVSLNLSAGYDPNVQLFGDVNQAVLPDARLFSLGVVSTHALNDRWECAGSLEYMHWQFVTLDRNQYTASFKLRYLFK